MSDRNPDSLTVTLTAVGDGPPADVRLCRALKLLLRTYGLRASWQAPPVPKAEASDRGPWACPDCGGLLIQHQSPHTGAWLACDGGCGRKVQVRHGKPAIPLRSFKSVVEAGKGRQVHR